MAISFLIEDVSDIIRYVRDGYSHCVTQLLSLFDYLWIALVALGAPISECALLCILQLDAFHNSLAA